MTLTEAGQGGDGDLSTGSQLSGVGILCRKFSKDLELVQIHSSAYNVV